MLYSERLFRINPSYPTPVKMFELVMYALVFLALIFHAIMAFRMYLSVHHNDKLTWSEKNSWKLKALIFPAYFWPLYKKTT